MNSDDSSPNKQFTFLRIIHSIFLASIPFFLVVSFLVSKLGIGPIFSQDAFPIHIIEIVLSFIAIIALFYAFYIFKVPRRLTTVSASQASLFPYHIVRISLIQAIAIYGLVLAILGSQWYIWVWFFVVSAAALILTFPTDERINNWTQNQTKS